MHKLNQNLVLTNKGTKTIDRPKLDVIDNKG